jgi:hypothetical protein
MVYRSVFENETISDSNVQVASSINLLETPIEIHEFLHYKRHGSKTSKKVQCWFHFIAKSIGDQVDYLVFLFRVF